MHKEADGSRQLTPRSAAKRAARVMIDFARAYDPNMCELYLPPAGLAPPAPARLDDFKQVFNKGPPTYIYGNYYNAPYDVYAEEETSSNVYHNLVSSREYPRDEWKYKYVGDWNEDESVSWILDTAYSLGFSEYDVPFYNFKITGIELRNMKKEDMLHRIAHPNVDPNLSARMGAALFDKLQARINEELLRQSSVLRYADSDAYQQQEPVHTVLDLDLDHKNRLYASDYKPNDSSLLQPCDSSDDAEDIYGTRHSETASPVCSYGSDASKSGDEDDKRKLFKRPPGRPKGSGRKICKRPRSVSVPEFLRNLLFDPKYCPTIIKWEDHSKGKFR